MLNVFCIFFIWVVGEGGGVGIRLLWDGGGVNFMKLGFRNDF